MLEIVDPEGRYKPPITDEERRKASGKMQLFDDMVNLVNQIAVQLYQEGNENPTDEEVNVHLNEMRNKMGCPLGNANGAVDTFNSVASYLGRKNNALPGRPTNNYQALEALRPVRSMLRCDQVGGSRKRGKKQSKKQSKKKRLSIKKNQKHG